MKLNKKKLKGMTLVEVIIALVIFVLLCTIMVRVGTITNSLLRNTDRMNNKTAAESPIGSVQDVDALRDAANAVYADPADALTAMGETDLTVVVSSGSYTHNVDVKKYSAKAAGEQATANGMNCDTSDHMNGDLQFYVIQP